MERFLNIKKGREIQWHPRTKLHPYVKPTTYFEAHPNLRLKQAIQQINMEKTVYDILYGSTPGDLQRLEIKHLTGEK